LFFVQLLSQPDNVHHALSVADHYIVLIHGEVAADFRKGEKTREEILDFMAGGERLQLLVAELEGGLACD
jgi:simple sugar transport system ATP-binding protein